MIKKVRMPQLGQTVEEATIEVWHRKEGEKVEKGDVLLEITTDKATLEVESYFEGILKKTLYKEGDVVPVDAVIALIGDPDDEVSDEMVREALEAAAAAPEAQAVPAPSPAAAPQPQPSVAQPGAPAARPIPTQAPTTAVAEAPPGRLFASPRARRVARELLVPLQLVRGSGPNGRIVERDVLAYAERLRGVRATPTAREIAFRRGVDLAAVRGTGPDGRVTRADVEAAPAAAPAVGRNVPLTAMRRIVAERMSESKATIPHFYLTAEVDMTAAVLLRKRLDDEGRKVSYNDMLIRACAMAFAEVPEMNRAWAGDGLLERPSVDIGLAVALDGGLIVPVVRACERKSLFEIAEMTRSLIERARGKRLTPDEYSGGGFTISNLGMFCVQTLAPIIQPGEVAILGVGQIAPKPVVVGDGIAIRQMTILTLACDHRVVDGAIAARFLKTLKEALEEPSSLL